MNHITQRTIVLASSSPRRQELIRSLGIPFEVIVSEVDENISTTMSPEKIVEELSTRKAKEVLEQLQEKKQGVVIGSDTVVVFQGQVLGKPKNRQDAFDMLQGLQGNNHQVYSGIACIDIETKKHMVKHRMTSVKIKPLSEQQIRNYINTGEPMDKAGSYGIQALGATFVEKIDGDYFNVVGLPLSLLSDMLKEFDIEVI